MGSRFGLEETCDPIVQPPPDRPIWREAITEIPICVRETPCQRRLNLGDSLSVATELPRKYFGCLPALINLFVESRYCAVEVIEFGALRGDPPVLSLEVGSERLNLSFLIFELFALRADLLVACLELRPKGGDLPIT